MATPSASSMGYDAHALFAAMLEAGASDLHLAVGQAPRVRVRGVLVALGQFGPLAEAHAQALVHEWLPPSQAEQFARDHDLDFAYAYGDIARFRGNLFGRHGGMGAVFRTIPRDIVGLAALGTPAPVARLAQATVGLVLVTGPTGSGKSTTLAAMLDAINQTRSAHIVTIEDPVEFTHRPKRCQITHREVGRDVDSFAEAVRGVGRQGADVVLIGELRDAVTMRLALQAAGAGALVFATVHTNSAPATIERIVNAFAAEEQPAVRGMLAEALVGIVAQQLLRHKDGKRRLAAYEILLANRAVASMIREGKTLQLTTLIQSSRQEGMQLMDDTLAALVQDGSVDAEAALAKAVDKASFAKDPRVAQLLRASPEILG